MRIAMMATGGIGGYLALKLTLAGHEVACIARAEHLDAIQEAGLTLKGPKGTQCIRPWMATNDPAEIGPVDAVIVAVKAGGLEAAARAILPIVTEETLVVPFLNGVESVERLCRILPKASVANGVAYISTTIDKPGVIAKVGAMNRFIFAERDDVPSARMEALHTAFVQAGIEAVRPNNITVELWTKMVLMCAVSGVTTAGRCTIGEIRKSPELSQLFKDVMREAHAVAIAKKIPLPLDLPELHWTFIATVPESMRASSAFDLERGNPLETPWINGAIVRIGKETGTPTPVNQTIQAVLTPFARGRH